ncbi:ABC transporter ATP-binding protein [Benzoatithermus flavus]|uniref:ABC transporter ATP-binding protein n=1 Tax=Benzoatithermus flavus TaxID=3108223 RepID=A0ABU8XW08_9PROT
MSLEVELAQGAPIPLAATLACGPGELLALVGPSGSGKTTILRAIAGLIGVARGRVTCNGAVWLDTAIGIRLPPHRRRVGFVFQSYALFPHLSALDNVAAALRHLPRGERRIRAASLLERVHLGGLEARLPGELSGGQQQRVAVARALAREPAVLLLDEPFSAVDKITREKLYRELVELRASLAIPTVLVTHDLDEAALLADRLTVLHRGRTLQTGAPLEVMQRPASVEVARLTGARNLLTGTVAGHEPDAGRTWLRWGGLTLEARLQPAFPPGASVAWTVAPGDIILHRRDRPSRGERENPVKGTIGDGIVLGESLHTWLVPDTAPGSRLALVLPIHTARRNGIAPGVSATVSLLAAAIHLMPVDDATT